MKEKILVLGALGQIGSDLTPALRNRYGNNNVIATDYKDASYEIKEQGPFIQFDILDKEKLLKTILDNNITQIYHLVAYLSAISETKPLTGWNVNIQSLLNVLEAARTSKITKIFWPSSIAVFGHSTPRKYTPQFTIMEPTTVYGISKLAGERWCEYYYNKYNIDVRSVRYPGIISYKALPGGGTTDYAVGIFHDAIKSSMYECYLKEDTILPMMYIDDAVNAAITIMDSDSGRLTIRSSYNIGAMSFSPLQLSKMIKKFISSFSCTYKPDSRQQIADSWPQSIDDSISRKDWNWCHVFDLEKTTKTMINELKQMIVLKI